MSQVLNARDYFLLGSAKYKCRACEFAVEDFSEALKLNKDYAEAWYGRSLSYACLEDYRNALKDIEKAIRLDPEQVLYLEAKARFRAASGDQKGALRDYRTVLEQDSLVWQAWYGLAMGEMGEGNYPEAETAFDNCIDLKSDFTMAYIGRAELFLAQNRNQEALINLIQAADQEPRYAPIYELRSLANLRLENYDGATKDASTALKLDPESKNAYYYRAEATFQLGNYALAEPDYGFALKIDKKFARAWFRRAECRDKMGDWKTAKKFFTKAIKSQSDYKEAYVSRANVHLKLEKPKKAIGDLSSAIDLDKKDLDLIEKRGFLYLDVEEHQNAIQDFYKILREKPNHPAATFGMGNAKYQEGNVKGACQDWHKALELGDGRAAEKISQFCFE